MKLEIYEQEGQTGAVEVDGPDSLSWWYRGDSTEVRGVLARIGDMEVVKDIDGEDGEVSENTSTLNAEEQLAELRLKLLSVPDVLDVDKIT